MNDDFSEVLSKFSEILKEKNINIDDIQDRFKNNINNDDNSNESQDFSLDINTIFKIKEIISAMNSTKDCPRNKLLNSLKPYLENSKKEKLEQYIKIANLLTALESINTVDIPKKTDYDMFLIIILILLII